MKNGLPYSYSIWMMLDFIKKNESRAGMYHSGMRSQDQFRTHLDKVLGTGFEKEYLYVNCVCALVEIYAPRDARMLAPYVSTYRGTSNFQ